MNKSVEPLQINHLQQINKWISRQVDDMSQTRWLLQLNVLGSLVN